MAIDPYRQLALFCAAFLAGVLLGVLWELVTASRILLGAYRAPEPMRPIYERPLPLLKRPVGMRELSARRLWRGVVVALGDFLFSLVFAAVIVLVLYYYNDGKFRPLVPLLTLGGFALFRLVATALLGGAVAYFAFGVAALRLYIGALLRLPIRLVCWLARLCWRPLAALGHRIYLHRARAATRRLCLAQTKEVQEVLALWGHTPVAEE